MERIVTIAMVMLVMVSLAGCSNSMPWTFCINSLSYSDYLSPYQGVIFDSYAGNKWVTADVSITNMSDSTGYIPDWHGTFSLAVLATDGEVYFYPDGYIPEAEFAVRRNQAIPAKTTIRGELYFRVPDEMLFIYGISFGIVMTDGQYVQPSVMGLGETVWFQRISPTMQEEAGM